MSGPKIDLTINLGHMISISAIIITMIVGWVNFDGRLRAVEKTLETATATLIEQVKQGAELRAVSDRVARLERIVEATR